MALDASSVHRLARAHLIGLCAVFRVSKVPRIYTSRWPREYGADMAMYSYDTMAIYINTGLHETIQDVYDSVAHEFCHHVTRSEPSEHGPRWRAAAKRAGISPTP